MFCLIFPGFNHRGWPLWTEMCNRMCFVRSQNSGGREKRPLLQKQRPSSLAIRHPWSEGTGSQEILWEILCRSNWPYKYVGIIQVLCNLFHILSVSTTNYQSWSLKMIFPHCEITVILISLLIRSNYQNGKIHVTIQVSDGSMINIGCSFIHTCVAQTYVYKKYS